LGKIVGFVTDGVPAVTGKNNGATAKLKKENKNKVIKPKDRLLSLAPTVYLSISTG
jgi:uncharacterized protein (UPF0297 family)